MDIIVVNDKYHRLHIGHCTATITISRSRPVICNSEEGYIVYQLISSRQSISAMRNVPVSQSAMRADMMEANSNVIAEARRDTDSISEATNKEDG